MIYVSVNVNQTPADRMPGSRQQRSGSGRTAVDFMDGFFVQYSDDLSPISLLMAMSQTLKLERNSP